MIMVFGTYAGHCETVEEEDADLHDH